MNGDHSIDTLNELLKGEHMAIHIYEKTKLMQEDSQVADMLSQFEQDHKRHAEQLTERIKDLSGYPDATTGISGIMANVSSVINSIRGPQHLLEQVYDGRIKEFMPMRSALTNLILLVKIRLDKS